MRQRNSRQLIFAKDSYSPGMPADISDYSAQFKSCRLTIFSMIFLYQLQILARLWALVWECSFQNSYRELKIYSHSPSTETGKLNNCAWCGCCHRLSKPCYTIASPSRIARRCIELLVRHVSTGVTHTLPQLMHAPIRYCFRVIWKADKNC